MCVRLGANKISLCAYLVIAHRQSQLYTVQFFVQFVSQQRSETYFTNCYKTSCRWEKTFLQSLQKVEIYFVESRTRLSETTAKIIARQSSSTFYKVNFHFLQRLQKRFFPSATCLVIVFFVNSKFACIGTK